MKKICIVGPGAVGGMMAVLMSRKGYEVSAVARPAKAAEMNAKGVTLIDGGKTFTEKIKAVSDPKDLGPQDLLIITVKGDGLPWAVPHLQALSHATTPWLFVMNGVPWWFFSHFGAKMKGLALKSVDPDGLLAKSVPLERVVWGVINCRVDILADGTLNHEHSQELQLGRPDASQKGLADIAKPFIETNYTATTPASIHASIWNKLVANIVFNPLSALTMSTNDVMLADPLVRDLAVKITDEIRVLGERLGISGGLSGAERFPPGRAIPKVKTSMLSDAERGRPLELAPIIGAAVEIAGLCAVPIPYTTMVYGLLRLRAQSLISQ
ncbi:MAG: 2-dehydropantoate 2-reductase [Rhodospirillaceae bacterium]|nr:2-dehydropantoate 2-reductase [Rhodospirillaceae bacterium]